MFRIIKLLVGLAGLAVFVWCGSNIPLGSRTLFQHLQAIGGTRETQELLDGTRQSAQPLVDGVRRRLGNAASGGEDDRAEDTTTKAVPDGGAPAESPRPTAKACARY